MDTQSNSIFNRVTVTTLLLGLVLSGALADAAPAIAKTVSVNESAQPPAPPAGWTDHYVLANDIRIHYWRTGGENKPKLVLLHGSSDYGLCWTNLAKEFTDDYDIILADARGHGFSDPPSRNDPASAQADDIAGLIGALGLEKPIVMGHSMGAAAAIWFAAKYPDMPGAVILEDPRLISGDTAFARPATPEEVEKSRERIVARNNMPYAELVADQLTKNPQWGRSEIEYWAPSKRFHHPNTAFVRRDGRPPVSELFEKITVPTLILKADAQGEERKQNEAVAALLRDGSIVHIAGAKHNVRRDQKDSVVQEMWSFLAEVQYPFRIQNLLPWSIANYDSKQRTSAERVQMLAESGFRHFVYGGSAEQRLTMKEEWRLAEASGLKIDAVYLFLNTKKDQPGNLTPATEAMLQSIRDEGLHTQIWVAFQPDSFRGLNDSEALQSAKAMTDYLCLRAEAIGCKIALYNHGGWLGEPENQIKVIESLPGHRIGIIYNFHHAHEQLDRYPQILDRIMPHLWAVNLNGINKEGPKIITIGEGKLEKPMIAALLERGFKGPFGVLGHVKDVDARVMLQKNVNGLQGLFPKDTSHQKP